MEGHCINICTGARQTDVDEDALDNPTYEVLIFIVQASMIPQDYSPSGDDGEKGQHERFVKKKFLGSTLVEAVVPRWPRI